MNISHYIEYLDSLSSIDLSIDLSECDRLNLVFQKMLKDFKLKQYSDVSIEINQQNQQYMLVGSNVIKTSLGVNIYFAIEKLSELVFNTVNAQDMLNQKCVRFIGD